MKRNENEMLRLVPPLPKMGWKACTIAFAFLASVIGSFAYAQNSPLTERQTEILKEVLRVDGSLTRTQYFSFWSDFDHLSASAKEQFRKDFRAHGPQLIAYQKVLWLAAQESTRQGKPVVTPELQNQFDLIEKTSPRSKREQRLQISKQRAKELLEAAAYREQVTREDGIYEVTPEVITKVLAGLDGSRRRLDQLLLPHWQPIDASKAQP